MTDTERRELAHELLQSFLAEWGATYGFTLRPTLSIDIGTLGNVDTAQIKSGLRLEAIEGWQEPQEKN